MSNPPLRITCKTCHRPYRWVRELCPHCFQPNGIRPSLLLAMLVIAVAAGAAIWFLMHLLVNVETSPAQAARPDEAKPSAIKRLFTTPAPEPQQEVDFKR
jgi:hypothetical protein